MVEGSPRISWRTEEYVHREKNVDWYWALGVIALAAAAISVIYHDVLFAVFIALSAVILGFYAKRPPELVSIVISERGIRIRETFFPFETIKGFSIDTHELGTYLLIETSRRLIPVVSIPVPDELDKDGLADLLRTRVSEKTLKEPVSHRLMEHLGF